MTIHHDISYVGIAQRTLYCGACTDLLCMNRDQNTKWRCTNQERECDKKDVQTQCAFIWIQSRCYVDLKTHKIDICQQCAHCTIWCILLHILLFTQLKQKFYSLSGIDSDQIQMFTNQSTETTVKNGEKCNESRAHCDDECAEKKRISNNCDRLQPRRRVPRGSCIAIHRNY